MKNKKVLIIDDEKDFGILMQSFFTPRNYQEFVAYTIAEGLKLLEEQQPDFIFLDNNLPDGKGRDAIDPIVKKYPSLNIYLISAYHQKADFLEPHKNVIVWEKPILLSLLDETF